MPKRKRDPRDTGEDDPQKQVEAKIIHGKKILNKAMKLARSFERQKLDKRTKVAEKEDASKKDRLAKESEALKTLDVAKVVDAHLYKTLLKIKTIVESNLLPDFVVVEKSRREGEDGLAYDNVTARMVNTKAVKEAMAQIMAMVYAAAGVPNPALQKNKKAKKDVKEPKESKRIAKDEENEGSEIDERVLISKLKAVKADAGTEPAWDGFDSGSEADSESDEDFDKYRSRIVGSSDEEEEDDDGYDSADFTLNKTTKSSEMKTLNPRDLSITPSPPRSREVSPSPSISLSDADTDNEASPPPPPKATKEKRAKVAPPPPTKSGSQFLPSLMGGYWSGTDSEVDDFKDTAPAIVAPRKNRRGQIERRKIAELKYGSSAKHIQAGKVPSKEMGRGTREMKGKNAKGTGRDDGWDPKRGASDASDRRGGKGRAGFTRNRELVTGENAAPLGARPLKKHRDDVGSLHPSWAAAKKLKEEKKTAKFEGKKVVFD